MNAPSIAQNPLSTAETTSVENVAPGVILEWLDNRAIAAFTFHTVARDAIACTWDRMRESMETWPDGLPYLGLADFSDPNLGMTPYIRERSQELATWRPELRGRVAIVLPRNFMLQLVTLIVRKNPHRMREVQIFTSHEKALAWLRQAL